MTSAWRGFNAEPYLYPPHLQDALNLKANLVRYQIAVIDAHLNPPIDWTIEEWTTFVRDHLNYIDSSVLPLLPNKARLIIDMHHPPGWFLPNGKAALFTTKPQMRALLIDLWEEIAARYQNEPLVFCYDILNEPAGGAEKVNDLNRDIVTAIRNIDSKKRITVSSPFGDPMRFDEVDVINSTNIWYQTHFYYPLKFTSGEIPTYPTANWNRAFLEEKLAKVRAFQQDHGVRIFAGEFGCPTAASDNDRSAWYSDCIKLFERYNWNWTFHAWTTYDPWRVIPDYPLTLDSIASKWALNTKR